jgi:hypothetical protein
MRKTSNDYRKELNGFKKSVESTEAHIKSRLLELSEKFPDAIVSKKGVDMFKARCLSKTWIDRMPIETQLDHIEAIEEYTASLEKHQQVTMY